ncbi:lysophospholipid acyltransferase family protein [Paenibacillus koleovorans]|uniref:lysophospholipid acyltransferase family protein n=1 Tax=Paenibacillus koleovorans TaxID=121608 RepID=UPI000FD7674D|nr:lysophospholipid acyltransferase family protein [Paenibacillus koleovorans]
MYDWIGRWTGMDGSSPGETKPFFFRMMSNLPSGPAFWLCAAAAGMLYVMQRPLRRRLLRNAQELFEPASPRENRRIVKHYCRNLAVAMYEILFLSAKLGKREDGWNPIREAHGEEHLEQALSEGKGAIVYLPHVGNFFVYYWYLMGRYNCTTVATASSNELRPLYRRFAELGCRGFDYDETNPIQLMRSLRDHLKQGGVVYLLGDFYRPNFPEATLFGRKTHLPQGAAMLALQYEVPIVPMTGRGIGRFAHRLQFEPPIRLSDRFRKNELRAASDLLNQWMEQSIRRHPDSWFYLFQAEERWCEPAPSNPIQGGA